jgi:hypothetical protein
MIIWINGAFGVGKTHTAYELRRRSTNSFVFDPEKVGFFLRKYLPRANTYDNFQDIPLWKQQVKDNLIFCNNIYPYTLVPMTIIDDDIFDFIIRGLKKEGIEIQHFSLLASKEIVEQRLIKRGNKNAWNFKQVDKCLNSLKKEKYQEHINTEILNLDAVVEFIANKTHINLVKPRLTGLAKRLNWMKITIRHMRKL